MCCIRTAFIYDCRTLCPAAAGRWIWHRTFLLLELWIFYIGTHLLIMIRDSIFITKHNPLKMLRKEKTQELPKANLFYTVSGIVLLAAAYIISLRVDYLYTALNVLMWAVIMVIIGTYFLYNGAVIYLLRKLQSKEKYIIVLNICYLFLILLFRLRSYATSMASITILLSMLILTFSMCTSLYSGVEDTVRKDFMDYEFKLYGLLDGNEGREDDEYNNARTLNEQKLSSLIKKHHLTVEKIQNCVLYKTSNTVALRENTMFMGAVFASGDDAGIYQETTDKF